MDSKLQLELAGRCAIDALRILKDTLEDARGMHPDVSAYYRGRVHALELAVAVMDTVKRQANGEPL